VVCPSFCRPSESEFRRSSDDITLRLLTAHPHRETTWQPYPIDTVAATGYGPSVAIQGEIVKAMQKRMMQEFRRIKAAGAEMDKLTDAFHRYQDLRQERRKRERRVKHLVALLYPEHMPQNEETAKLGQMIFEMDSVPAPGELAVWEVLEEYLAVAGETPIIDAADILPWFTKRGVTRQGIESAARRHPDIFQVRQGGGKRLISLRE
jgi:hypothetical protein